MCSTTQFITHFLILCVYVYLCLPYTWDASFWNDMYTFFCLRTYNKSNCISTNSFQFIFFCVFQLPNAYSTHTHTKLLLFCFVFIIIEHNFFLFLGKMYFHIQYNNKAKTHIDKNKCVLLILDRYYYSLTYNTLFPGPKGGITQASTIVRDVCVIV